MTTVNWPLLVMAKCVLSYHEGTWLWRSEREINNPRRFFVLSETEKDRADENVRAIQLDGIKVLSWSFPTKLGKRGTDILARKTI